MAELLAEFKTRMKIFHSAEDNSLTAMLEASIADIKEKCGDFNLSENKRAKELIFERARYAYNDKLEDFDDNFLSQIQSLQFELYEVVDDGTNAN